MKKLHFIIGLVALAFSLSFYIGSNNDELQSESVNDLMEIFTDSTSRNANFKTQFGFSAAIGEDLVKNGFSKRKNMKKAKKQSKHFVCTSCHNVEREDPDLANPNAQDRLVYVDAKGLPFLQGTTLYGIVNRTTFYNGDYEKKYGDLVIPAREDIREAIQLCAQECAQGRKLKDWEVESILAYLWTLDLKISDLDLTEKEIATINEAATMKKPNQEVADLLSSKFSSGHDIHFTFPPEDRKEGYEIKGNFKNGKLIYENSCLHCHYNQKYSYFDLDKNKMSYKYLSRKAGTYSRHSLYQVIRYGTYPKHGKKSYMPLYPEEKMSDQQIEDLRAYLRVASS